MHTRNEQARPCVYLCQVQKSDVKLKLKLLKLFKIFQGICGTSSPGLATNSIFFCFLSVKNHWFAHHWPLVGETLLSSVPPSNSLVSVSDPRRAFWADTAPFSGPRLTSCVASGTTEIQGHRQVCRARPRGHRTPSRTTDANLDCAFVENAPTANVFL